MNDESTIRGLIRACVDDQRTLLHESKLVGTPLGATLGKFAHERDLFLTDLEQLAKAARRPSGSLAEHVREAAREIWVLGCGPNHGDAIAVCRHSRARTQARYEEALRRDWPSGARSMLAEQNRRLEAEADELRDLQF